MAILSLAATHDLTQQQWSNEMFQEHLNEIYMKPFMGTKMKSPIIVKEEMEKAAGETLTLPKTYLLAEDSGVDGTTTLEGKEQALEFGASDHVAVEKRNAVRFRNGLTVQRTAIEIRDTAREVLTIWKAQETDNKIFTSLVASPTSSREISCDSTATHDAAASSSGVDDIATTDVVTVKAIRKLKLHAITGAAGTAEKIRGYRDGGFGKQTFLLFLDPFSLMDLKADADYQAYATEDAMGRAKFFQGGVTDIDGVIIIECDKIPRVTNAGSVSTAKNIFMGCGAAAVNWAGCQLMDGQTGKIQYAEETFDYGNQVGIAVGDVKGVKKLKFDKEGVTQQDEGVILFYSASIVA